jgi:uncharacterized protein (TIRG00374 family)
MLMAKALAPDTPQHTKGRLLLLVLFLLLMYVVLPRLGNFSDSVEAIKGAHIGLVLFGAAVVAATYVLAAGIYQLLGLRRLYFRRTLLVQAANAFANRLLPAGLGGLTLSVQYLRRSGYSLSQALAVAGANNALGLIGHVILMSIAIVASGGALLDDLKLPEVPHAGWLILGVVALVAANLLIFRRLRQYLYKLTTDVSKYLAAYRKYPARLLGALACSLGLTCGYALALYLCAQAVGIDLSLWNMFVVFTVGLVATAVTPTPGGLGGAEAGLVAGMVAYGVEASPALAAVLIYRLLTYWLPLLPGFFVLLGIRKRYL